MCFAMADRMGVIASRRPPLVAAGTAGAGSSSLEGDSGWRGRARGSCSPVSRKATTSRLRTRPPTPVPDTSFRSTPCSSAMRRTTGENTFDRSASCAEASAGGSAATPFELSSGWASPGLAPASIAAIGVPTETVVPGSTSTEATRPEQGEGISTSILSVVTSQIVSSASTQSPGRLRHSRTVPSATETPICGITTSVRVSVGEELTAGLLHVVRLRKHGLLQRGAERDRNIGGGQPPNWRVEVLEGLGSDQRRDFGAHTAGLARLVRHEHLAGLSGTGKDRLRVERSQAPQVQHLDVLVQLLRGGERQPHRGPIGDDGHLAALADHVSLPQRDGVLALGNLSANAAVEALVLEEAHGIGVADRADQQALRVGGRGRRHHLQARNLKEPGLRVLGVERAAGEAAARGQADHHRHRHSLAVMHLRRDVDKLIEAAGDEVRELHLAHRPHALGRRADGGADDRALGERGIQHALRAELLVEAVGDLERATKRADVLAQAEDRRVAAHLLPQSLRDRLQVRQLPGRRCLLRALLGLDGAHAAPPALDPLPFVCVAQRDQGAFPSPRGWNSSANTPSIAAEGSGIGEASAASAAATTSSATSDRTSSISDSENPWSCVRTVL